MSWLNEPDNNQGRQPPSTPVGKVVSYVLLALAIAVVFCALQIGYSFATVRGCTPSEAVNLAWHWFVGGPIWLVVAAFTWFAARAASRRLR
jgi:hypothetical protein